MKGIKYVLIFFALLFSVNACFAADVELYVVRHGKTFFNTVRRAQGWSDTPLTAEGAAVVQKLGKGLKTVNFVTAWSSDSGRARETAKLIMAANNNPLPVGERMELREAFFGQFEGDMNVNMQAAAAKEGGYGSAAELLNGFENGSISVVDIVNMIKAADKSGQAESYPQIAQRVMKAVKEIAQDAQRRGGGNVLIVSHGIAIMTLMHELGDKSLSYPLINASVSKIRYTDEGKFIIESINDVSYLQRGS